MQNFRYCQIFFVLFNLSNQQAGDVADAPTYRPLYDNDPNLYELQKGQKPKHKELQIVIYGESRGFGNKISIQTIDIVFAAKAVGKVHKFREGFNYWPVCHIEDNTSLYISILRAILGGQNPDHGKNGYYLASPGRVNWNDIYGAMAAALAKHEIVPRDQALALPSDDTLGRIAEALGQAEKTSVEVTISGNCTFTAEHGKALGWKPKHSPEDILANADREVEFILGSFTEKHVGLRQICLEGGPAFWLGWSAFAERAKRGRY
ncbi:hypothetical protein HII31_07767 [Pseudocercospora fuligena]|uniref:NmrA-like domain-containing protein n=1 Tax=Pseudocercospora fuligena TaxID=685502 RepID=A0A8H6RGC4_9PEZI|nr:hypothetical protein HII31_07767 [Pseudocercospora fuligena]